MPRAKLSDIVGIYQEPPTTAANKIDPLSHPLTCALEVAYQLAMVPLAILRAVSTGVIRVALFVGLPIAILYLVVRLIHWAWETPISAP